MRVLFFVFFIFPVIGCYSQQTKMTADEYNNLSEFLWKSYVPNSGQAETVQGELIRAIEKLRDEAQRNGNINFRSKCHRILIAYLKKHLVDATLFDQSTVQQISKDLKRLSIENKPYTEDDIYDRITERIVDWYLLHTSPIINPANSKLDC